MLYYNIYELEKRFNIKRFGQDELIDIEICIESLLFYALSLSKHKHGVTHILDRVNVLQAKLDNLEYLASIDTNNVSCEVESKYEALRSQYNNRVNQLKQVA